MPAPVFTLGHSTRPFDVFVALLHENAIEHVVDVRRIPASRRFPHYAREALAQALPEQAVAYTHCMALGGRRARSPQVDPAVNGFWENRSFHNYADYTLSDAFQQGLQALLELSATRRCAMVCAEAVWWRCHRRIITDYLLAHSRTVCHIMDAGKVVAASMTPGARITAEGLLNYPPL